MAAATRRSLAPLVVCGARLRWWRIAAGLVSNLGWVVCDLSPCDGLVVCAVTASFTALIIAGIACVVITIAFAFGVIAAIVVIAFGVIVVVRPVVGPLEAEGSDQSFAALAPPKGCKSSLESVEWDEREAADVREVSVHGVELELRHEALLDARFLQRKSALPHPTAL